MSLALLVNDRRYEGWRAVTVTRTIRAAAGSFELEITDRWTGQELAWPIVEEDECRVELSGTVVINGWVGTRSQTIAAGQRSFSVGGKDRAGILVECSALMSGRWSFRNATALDIARQVAGEYGISVSLAAGTPPPPVNRKLVVNPGETAWEVIQRAAQTAGLLAISDGNGGLQLANAGTSRAPALVEGQNVLAANVSYNAQDRFYRYIVLGQTAGSDNQSGNATRITATAIDNGVSRTDRVMVLRAQRNMSVADAKRYADWVARLNAANSETVNVTVQGWESGGSLWPINAITGVSIPSIGVDGEMLIAEARHVLSEQGTLTELSLVRPDAFSPDPSAVVRTTGADWKKPRGAS